MDIGSWIDIRSWMDIGSWMDIRSWMDIGFWIDIGSLMNIEVWMDIGSYEHWVLDRHWVIETLHNGGARGHFNFSQFWDLLTRCINFYSHSLIFPAILPPLIVYNLFIWWYRWVSGEEYYHFLYFAFSVAQTVQKLQVSCFFRSVNGSRESHYTLQHP